MLSASIQRPVCQRSARRVFAEVQLKIKSKISIEHLAGYVRGSDSTILLF